MRAAYVVVLTALLLTVMAMGVWGCDNETAPVGSSPLGTTATVSEASPVAGASPSANATSSEAKRRLTQQRIMAAKARQEAQAALVAQAARAGNETTTTSTTGWNGPALAPPLQQPSTQGGRYTPTAVVLTRGRTPVRGLWSGSADRLASFLSASSPSPGFAVPVQVLAEYYMHYCAEAGLRADLLWAQMIHETGYGRFGGDVSPEQNNYAGIGATGGGAAGFTFTSAEAGVMAHVAHMVAYVYASSPVPWAGAMVDPRFDLVNPRGAVSVLSDLDGRWAVPGEGYGERIETIARAVNGR